MGPFVNGPTPPCTREVIMLLWLLVALAAAAAVCFFVDAKSWTARGLFLLALLAFIDLLNQAVH